jgi:hypothetical protein
VANKSIHEKQEVKAMTTNYPVCFLTTNIQFISIKHIKINLKLSISLTCSPIFWIHTLVANKSTHEKQEVKAMTTKYPVCFLTTNKQTNNQTSHNQFKNKQFTHLFAHLLDSYSCGKHKHTRKTRSENNAHKVK